MRQLFYLSRKTNMIICAVVAALCGAASIFFFITWGNEQQATTVVDKPSFNTLRIDQLKDDLETQGIIDMSFGTYAETYNTNWGIRTSDKSNSLFYLIPIYNVKEDGNPEFKYFISYKAYPDDFATMDKIEKQTWSYESDYTQLTIENGTIQKLPGQYQQYLKEWMETPDFYENGSFIDWCVENNIFGTNDRDVIESKVVPYMIINSGSSGSFLLPAVIFLSLCVFCVVLFLVLKFHKKPLKGIDAPVDEGFRQMKEMNDDL